MDGSSPTFEQFVTDRGPSLLRFAYLLTGVPGGDAPALGPCDERRPPGVLRPADPGQRVNVPAPAKTQPGGAPHAQALAQAIGTQGLDVTTDAAGARSTALRSLLEDITGGMSVALISGHPLQGWDMVGTAGIPSSQEPLARTAPTATG